MSRCCRETTLSAGRPAGLSPGAGVAGGWYYGGQYYNVALYLLYFHVKCRDKELYLMKIFKFY